MEKIDYKKLALRSLYDLTREEPHDTNYLIARSIAERAFRSEKGKVRKKEFQRDMPKLLAPFIKDGLVQKITISDDGRHGYRANLEKREEIEYSLYVVDLTEEETQIFLQYNQK